jgi:hypothetical protein
MKGHADYIAMPLAKRVANLLKSVGRYARIVDIDHMAFDAAIWAVMVEGDDPALTAHHDAMDKYPIYEDVKRFLEQEN